VTTKAQDNKRKLILRLRRQVKVSCHFDVTDAGEGRERQTCRECGKSVIVDHAKKGIAPQLLPRLIAYRSTGGVIGVCPTCSKRRAIERYPLPEDK
jgi:ribosomal protein S27AE